MKIMQDCVNMRKSAYIKHHEWMMRIAQYEAWDSITAKGWVNRMFHALFGRAIVGNWI